MPGCIRCFRGMGRRWSAVVAAFVAAAIAMPAARVTAQQADFTTFVSIGDVRGGPVDVHIELRR